MIIFYNQRFAALNNQGKNQGLEALYCMLLQLLDGKSRHEIEVGGVLHQGVQIEVGGYRHKLRLGMGLRCHGGGCGGSERSNFVLADRARHPKSGAWH